ncbi:hypothetical protein BGX26_010914 [Mortierella sp. AD094]|nr:hypothetical protein BGX26_010914 [Mortierella sp. AD094]
MQRQTVDRILTQFIADNANLDPIELKELRFDPSPRGENVIQHMRRDKDAPIKLTNRSFVLRGTEPEMIAYIRKVFNSALIMLQRLGSTPSLLLLGDQSHLNSQEK